MLLRLNNARHGKISFLEIDKIKIIRKVLQASCKIPSSHVNHH